MNFKTLSSSILNSPAATAHKTAFGKSAAWTRKNKNIAGLTACVILFCSGFVIHGNTGIYLNLYGLLIVLGGTCGATLVSFRINRLLIAYRVLKGSYRAHFMKPDEIVKILVDLSIKCKFQGILALQKDEEETTVLFLRRALGFLVDGYELDQIRDLLNTEMYFFKIRREETEQVFRAMAEMAPSFGLIGSIVGLVGMLSGINDASTILKTIPIALTSTLYGVIFANFLLFPFALNIRERTDHELLLQKIIMEGVIAIGNELHPRILEETLKSFLTPSSRKEKLVSLKRIQEKFMLKKTPDA